MTGNQKKIRVVTEFPCHSDPDFVSGEESALVMTLLIVVTGPRSFDSVTRLRGRLRSG